MLNATIKGLLFVLTFYATLVALMYALQSKMLYFPDPTMVSPARAGVGEMDVVVVTTADGLQLSGWYAPSPTGKPVVVLFHGNAGNISSRAFKARSMLDAGYGVLLAEYRGYGGNVGTPSEQGLYADARAFLDYLADHDVPSTRIVLYGESLGTGVAVQMAAEQPSAGLILESPYTSLPDVAADHYPWLPVRLLMKDRFNSAAKIEQIIVPKLFLHGARDGTIAVSFGETLYALASDPKQLKIFPAAGHNDLHVHGGTSAVLNFLAGF